MKPIRAHEAHNDNNAVETVINGRRNLGIIGLTHNSLTKNIQVIILDNIPEVIKVMIIMEKDLQSKAIYIMMVNQDGLTSLITLCALFKEKEIIN